MAEEIFVLKRPKKKEDYIEIPLKKPIKKIKKKPKIPKPTKKPKVSKPVKKSKVKPFLKLGDIDEQAADDLNSIIRNFKRELDERVKEKEALLNKKLQMRIAKNNVLLKKAEARIQKE